MYKKLFILSCVALLFTACMGEKKEDKWTSFVYPDKQNTKRNLKSPMDFESLDQCISETKKQMTRMKLNDNGFFKCGLNCEFHDGMKLEICERMETPKEK